jgi:hypothetical protein
MFSDEKEGEGNENPIEGLGKEMLPDRGLPFDEIDENVDRGSTDLAGEFTEPRDLSPEELAELLGGSYEPVEDVIEVMSRKAEEVEGGMGAAEPILADEDIDEIDLPVDELEIPPSTSIAGMPISDESGVIFSGAGVATSGLRNG